MVLGRALGEDEHLPDCEERREVEFVHAPLRVARRHRRHELLAGLDGEGERTSQQLVFSTGGTCANEIHNGRRNRIKARTT